MSILSILGIAVALAMDAFAVALATGIRLRKVNARQTFRLSWHFGLFQALMPLLGWSLGQQVQGYIEAYAHWLAFFLLALVGANMLREALRFEEMEKQEQDATRGLTMVILAIATSIDALAVGISMSLLKLDIILPALIIGLVACIFTILGLHLGKKIAGFSKLSSFAELTGGLLLWIIGIKILMENGVFTKIFS